MAQSPKEWSGKVNTVSTYPPEGLFTKDPDTIVRALASKRVSAQECDVDFLYQSCRKEPERRAKMQTSEGKLILSARLKAERAKQRRDAQ